MAGSSSRPALGFVLAGLLASCGSGPEPESAATIRDLDLGAYLAEREESALRDCPSQPALEVVAVAYADLDSDGSEEAVVEARTCWMGTGGLDISEVLKLGASGEIVPLQFAEDRLEGLHEGVQLTPRLRLEKGRLTRWWVMYPKSRSHPKSGWERRILYRWDGGRFAVESVKTDAPVRAGSSGPADTFAERMAAEHAEDLPVASGAAAVEGSARVVAENAACLEDLARTQADLTDAEARIVQLETELATTQEELAATQAQLSQTQTELTQSQANLRNCVQDLEAVTAERDVLEGELQQTQAELLATRNALTLCEGELAKKEPVLAECVKELSGEGTLAFRVNDLGQVVIRGGQAVSYLYGDGVIVPLRDLMEEPHEWQSLRAQGLNDEGWIIGSGVLGNKTRAFIMIPTDRFYAVD